MKIRLASLLLLTAFLFSGCIVYSLHPLYTEKDVIFDEALLGTWMHQNKPAYRFEKMEGKNIYQVTQFSAGQAEMEDGSVIATGTAVMVKLGQEVFLDFYPDQSMKCKGAVLFLPVHIPCKLWLEGDGMGFMPLDPGWLKDQLKRKKVVIKNEWISAPDGLGGHYYLLTASTQELQKFYARSAKDPQAFGKPDPFIRQGAKISPTPGAK